MTGLSYEPNFHWLYGDVERIRCLRCGDQMPVRTTFSVATPRRSFPGHADYVELSQRSDECSACFRRRSLDVVVEDSEGKLHTVYEMNLDYRLDVQGRKVSPDD